MMLVCGFLGCLGQAFKRSPSTSSMGAGEHPNHALHHQGDRNHHHGDRHNGRGAGRPVSQNGMNAFSQHPAAAGGGGPSAGPGPASDAERRVTPGGPLGGASTGAAQATSSPFEMELQAGAVASAAAVAAATQPATLVKLDRGGPSRRTPLHIAAERGQLHLLSAIIENLCCSATAALLAEDGGSYRDGGSDGGGEAARAHTTPPAGGGAGARTGSLGAADAVTELRGTGPEAAAEGASGRQQQHRHPGPGSQRNPGQQQPARGNASGMVEDFPIARPGAGGAPLAPEQYIQFHLNMQDADGTTALSLACRFGHVDCCRLLLANGSARTLSDARGNTPLHYAALRGHLGVLFMLLDEFVEPGQEEELNGYVDARNHAGCTPLHYAVWGRQSGSVQVLLQHGADVLPRNSRPAQELTPPVMVVGSTPLHLAAARGHVEICRIVLKTFAERVLEPLQLGEDDPQPPTLASLDPRVQVNANGHMPYQVAQRLGFYPLAMLLRPSIPILRLFSDEERAVRFYGPAPLRALAAEALNKKLLGELDALAAAAAAAAPPSAAAGGGGGVDAAAGARRPVSAPATLEQLAAAAAMDAAVAIDEEARGGGGSGGLSGHPHGQAAAADARASQAASTSGAAGPRAPPVSPSGGVGVGGAAAAAAAAGAGRRVGPLRALNVEIAVAGGTLDSGGRPSPGGSRRPLVLEQAAAGAHPSTPWTPPVGTPLSGQLLSPSAVSPRLMSPIAMVQPSPFAVAGGSTGGSGGSPSAAAVYPPSRGSSARRSTPPLGSNRSTPLPTSNRSSNAMLSAAPMVAALSRPPSAPRANGQSADSPRGQVLVSLPGQPDMPELQPLRTPPPGRDQASGENAGPAAVAAGSAAAGGIEEDQVASDTAAPLAAVDGEGGGGGGGAGTVYGPRTPVRQPSAGVLHVRRGLPTSPQGGGAMTAPVSTASGSAGGGGGISIPRPATSSSLATAGSVGTAIILESSPSGSRRGDGERPPGLVRLRSNPLFEDVGNGGGNRAAAAAQPAGAAAAAAGGAGALATPASASGMPPLAEDASEGEEGPLPHALAAAAPRGGASCVTVTPFVREGSGGGAGEPAGSGRGGRTTQASHAAFSAFSAPAAVDVAFARQAGSAAAAVAAAAAALAAVDDDEELECGVCMEPLPMVAIAPCRHQICGPCARRICCLNIQKPSHCPFCRATISAFVAPAPLTPTMT